MIFSTRSTYGLRAIINLAKQEKSGNVSLAVIAKQEKISLKYLERLFAILKKAGLIKAVKGAAGGYFLAKSSGEINVYDIVKALEGKLDQYHCNRKNEKIICGKLHCCETAKVLIKVSQAIDSTLKNIKLKQLI